MSPAELAALRAEQQEQIENTVSTALGRRVFRAELTDQQVHEMVEDLIGESDAINGIYQAGGIDSLHSAVRAVTNQRICGAA